MEKKLQEEKKAKEEYAKKVGQLTCKLTDWKKNLQKSLDQTTRVNLVQSLLTNNDFNLSISKASELMGISHSSVYYTPAPPSEEELEFKRIIDVLHTDNPSWGSRQMSMQLKSRGFNVGRRKARRYMDEMAIDPIYPKKKKKKDMPESKIYPYLLRNANIIRPNQAWSIDITYVFSGI